MPCFQAHQPAPPFPALHLVGPLMCHVSKLMNALLPHPPLLSVSPCLQRAMFLSSPTRSSLSLPSISRLPFSHLPWSSPPYPALSSSSPPVRHSSFLTCHLSMLTISLLPLPPLQLVNPPLCPPPFWSPPTRSSLFLPSSW